MPDCLRPSIFSVWIPARWEKGDVCDAGLIAPAHMQCVDTGEVGEGNVCDGELSAATHIQCVNTDEVGEGDVCDSGLVAATHIQCVDSG